MLVFVAVVVAAGLLVAGLLAGQVALLWAALAVSLAGAALLAFVLLRGRGQVADGAEPDSAEADAPAAVEAPEVAAESATAAEPAVVVESAAVDEPVAAAEPAVPAEPAVADEPAAAAESVAAAGSVPADEPTPALEPSGDQVVRVIPGRLRFHAADCRLLTGHSAERISLDEARDEGFTACTTCLPRRESAASAV